MKEESFVKRLMRHKSVNIIAVTIVVVIFFFVVNKNYLSTDNVRGILNAMSLSGTIGVGVACLLIGGGVDLAAGTEACFGGIMCALLLGTGMPWPVAVLLTLLFGAFMGAINAFFVNVLGFASFIVTISMSSIYTGIINVITNVQNVPVGNQSFWNLGSIVIFGVLPMPFLIMLALVIIYGFIMTYTGFGRSCYMCGGNPTAARLSGLNPKKTTTILYINNGMLAAVAGLVLASRMHAASPTAASSGALDAITAAVLGGVSFMGGAGGMGGLFIGLLLLNTFNAGLGTVNIPSYWQIVAQGVLLIIALWVDFLNKKSREKMMKTKA